MGSKSRMIRTVRWSLSLILVIAGLSVTWAWGEVAQLAEPQPEASDSLPLALYAVWQPNGADQLALFRSLDEGGSWQPLSLPQDVAPMAWADDGRQGLAVALQDGSLAVSEDRGDSWTASSTEVPILSLTWNEAGSLYLGTDGRGVFRLADDGTFLAVTPAQTELAQAPVRHLAASGERLYAATPTVLFHTDDGGQTWTKSLPAPGWISALAVIDPETVFVGTESAGIYRSFDAGQSWQPALEGLGLAAGQMVRITALRADSLEAGVLYAAVGHLLGSSQIHFSAEGVFVTQDGGASWQPLAGPRFPHAARTSALVSVSGRPLHVQAVTTQGLQGYEPDVAAYLAGLEDEDAQTRMAAARMLGLARAQEAGDALLAVLADPDPAVGMAAADALGRIGDPSTTGGLLVTLEHPDEQVRLRAARALGVMRVERAVEPLRVMLLNGEGLAVTVAAEALGRIGSPAALDALLATMADPDVTPRRYAAMAVLEPMGSEAVDPLLGLLRSSDGYTRRNAALALGWIGSPEATPALMATLEDGSSAVRAQAAWALGEIGDPAAWEALERVQAQDPVTRVQVEAQDALNRIQERPVTASRWPSSWAATLNQLQTLRWLILGMSLAGAAWLVLGNKRPLWQTAS